MSSHTTENNGYGWAGDGVTGRTADPDGDPPRHTGGNVCVECGGGECGLHPAGCVYGGFTVLTGYWLIAEGCELRHD